MAIGHPILGLLDEGERHGYDLQRLLEKRFGAPWRIEFGQLYRVLRGLEEQGWIRRRPAPSDRGPGRWIYRTTPAGRRELQTWLADSGADRRGDRDEFPVKMGFALARRPSAAPALVEERRRWLLERLRRAREAAARAHRGDDRAAALGAESRRRALEGEIMALDAWAPTAAVASAFAILGSDDPVLDLMLAALPKRRRNIASATVGSLAGLLALREGRADAAGVHLLDGETGEYNVPFVRHCLPDDEIVLVRLARREQGLLVAPGNPKKVCRVSDLTRPRVRLINRQAGAGTRLLLATLLHAKGIRPRDIPGWNQTVGTHDEVARAVESGGADVGIGLRSVAENHGLAFVPITQESYDLAVTAETFGSPAFAAVRRVLRSATFRRRAAALPGYAVQDMGEVVARVGAQA